MSSYFTDTDAGRRELQQALIDHGFDVGPDGADGDLGGDSARAIIAARIKYHLSRQSEALVDIDLQRELGLLTIQSPEVQAAGNFILNFIINQALKGTGITMDFAKISKAIAGGITGVLAVTGTMGVVYLQLPAEAQTHFPSFVYTVVPWINEAIGFAVGFCGVYLAPANKTV